MKTYFTLLFSLCIVLESFSRVVINWGFDQLTDESTIVAIATPTTITVTTNQCTVNQIKGTWVETSFRILGVIKGDRAIKELTVRHFALPIREAKTKDGVLINYCGDPRLLTFEPNSHKQYLMFLLKATDGRYVAVTGQEDPVDSVMQLKQDEQAWVNLKTVKP